MDTLLRKTITYPNVLIITVAESWFLTKSLSKSPYFQHIRERFLLPGILAALLVINLILFRLYSVLLYSRFISPLRTFPAPRGRNAIRGWLQTTASRDRQEYFLKWAAEDSNTEGVILLRNAVGADRLLATGPKALQEILVTNTYDWEKPGQARDFLRHVLGDGLIIVEGEQHKFQRKRVKPAFGFRQIKDLYPMMWKKAVAVTQAIAEEASASPTGSSEISNWASKVTLDIIGIAGLGREFHALKNENDPLIQNYEELLIPDAKRFLYFVSRVLGPDRLVQKLPWEMNRMFIRTTTALREITRELARDKRAAIKVGADEHFDLLSLLINTGDFSDNDLSDQLLTFLAAGHETTSSALTWTVFLLATHPDIQRRVRQEVQSALPRDPLCKSNPTDLATILERLPLLNGVASETLRLYPTVPDTVRRSNRPTTLLGRRLPAGTDVLICPWATNRLPAAASARTSQRQS